MYFAIVFYLVIAYVHLLAYLLTMGTLAHWILSAKSCNAEKEKALHTTLRHRPKTTTLLKGCSLRGSVRFLGIIPHGVWQLPPSK